MVWLGSQLEEKAQDSGQRSHDRLRGGGEEVERGAEQEDARQAPEQQNYPGKKADVFHGSAQPFLREMFIVRPGI